MIVAIPTKKYKRLERRKMRRMMSGLRPYKNVEERNTLTAIFSQVTKLAKKNPNVRSVATKRGIGSMMYVGGYYMGNWMTSITIGIDGTVYHMGHHTNNFEKVYPIIAAACTKPMEEREAFFKELSISSGVEKRGDRVYKNQSLGFEGQDIAEF